MHKQPLSSAWTLRAANNVSAIPSHLRDRTFAAWVPSSVHTVLLKHGAIDNPYLKDNEAKLHWIGESDWEYRCVFDADGELFDHERIDLCFDGLDTIATVRLNDREIGRSENMHVAYRFDARPALRKGRNELIITFQSPLTYARHWEKTLGPLPRCNGDGGPFNFIRKMACNFGWDWGPVCVTSGVWKDVRVEGWNADRVVAVRSGIVDTAAPSLHRRGAEAAEDNLLVPASATSASPRSIRLFVDVELATNRFPGDFSALLRRHGDSDWLDHVGFENTKLGYRFFFDIANPAKWWPLGHGDQPLYEFRCAIGRPDEEPHQLDEVRKLIGLRTIQLDTAPDDIGREFVIKVNGKPIFAKGFNWIPDDCFLDRATKRERYRTRIQQAIDCGCNMLRVWGGGIYETDDFYDLCDEMGMMVWQDFPFACAMYPEEEPFKSLVEQEVRQNVVRLSSHPSLVLWNGCNENLIAYRGWGNPPWHKQVEGRTWGHGFYFDLLPKLMAELDPSRPFWNASPHSGDPDALHGIDPNSPDHGNMHLWEVWHGKGDYTNYRNFIPRFCSEFGYQAPANWATFEKAIGAENMVRGNPLLAVHQKSPDGDARNERLLTKDFDIDDLSYDDLHYLLQLNQARALTTGVEWFRANAPRCMGSLIWQFNDCYPVTSWSAIDSGGRKKLLWYAVRKFHASRLLCIHPAGEALNVHLVNDTDEPWTGECTIAAHDICSPAQYSGRGQGEGSSIIPQFARPAGSPSPQPPPGVPGGGVQARPFVVAPRSTTSFAVPADLRQRCDPARSCIVAAIGTQRAVWFDAPDKQIRYPAPELSATIRHTGERNIVTLRADSFVRDLCFAVDRPDPAAEASEQLLTLFAGETVTFDITAPRAITPEQLLAWPIMNCANRFGARL